MPRLLKLAAAVGLLIALYWFCDWRQVMAALSGLDATCLVFVLLLFVPQTIVSAWRWQSLTAPLCRISLWEAARQTLVASAWNLAAPSKLGDLSKAAMLPISSSANRRRAWLLVVIEKLADVAALGFIWLVGAAWHWQRFWPIVFSLIALGGCLWLRTSRVALRASLASLLLWLLHLAQIHAMLRAAGVSVGLDITLARVPAAIFAGLAPLSLCGIGTRDGALIWLFSDVAPAATMAAVGLLTATRYLIPGAAGIACLSLAPNAPLIRSTTPAALPRQAGG